eukprot:s177_g4.t1
MLAVAFYFAWKRFNKRLEEQNETIRQMQDSVFHCWNQVADQDGYMGEQATRIAEMHNRLMMFDGRLVEQSNEHSMLHDYVCGLHYGLVESGGFLCFGFGLTIDQWTGMTTTERANLVAHGAMGSEQYLRLVRQRARAERADTTDVTGTHDQDGNEEHNDAEESESKMEDDHEMNDDDGGGTQPPSMTDLLEEVKAWHSKSLQCSVETFEMQPMQTLILAMLVAVCGGIDENMLADFRNKVADLFFRLVETARADRLQTSFHYRRIEAQIRNRGS